MTVRPGTRGYGQGKKRVGLYTELTPEVRQLLDDAAKHLNVPKWRLIEELVKHAGLKANETPEWWAPDLENDETADSHPHTP